MWCKEVDLHVHVESASSDDKLKVYSVFVGVMVGILTLWAGGLQIDIWNGTFNAYSNRYLNGLRYNVESASSDDKLKVYSVFVGVMVSMLIMGWRSPD